MLDEAETQIADGHEPEHRAGKGPDRRAELPPRPRRLSNLLRDLAFDTSRERIAVGDLCDSFGDRAFGALIFLFAIPNILPVPIPGISALTGLPLMVLTLQFMRGQDSPWLPEWIRRRSFARTDFALMLARLEPWLLRLERYLRPRLGFLVRPAVERLFGGLLLFLAFVLFLPIPLGNMLPGFAMSLIALAIVERDGLCMLMGLGTAAVSIAIVGAVVYGVVLAAWFFLTRVV